MDNKDNMSYILEGIPHQPIDESEYNHKKWADIALPLVRKVFKELEEKEKVYRP